MSAGMQAAGRSMQASTRHDSVCSTSSTNSVSRTSCRQRAPTRACRTSSSAHGGVVCSRRDALLSTSGLLLSYSAWGAVSPALAIQGLTAGRIPGLSPTPGEDGLYVYSRPEGKSGGHGVGWSEIPRYEFKVYDGWKEIPVSIADLGGTEIDLRYQSRDQGDISIVVAPVARFADIGFNANISITQLGDPTKIIKGFAPELFGVPVEDEDILDTTVEEKDGLTYYSWHVKPYRLVCATATGNRMFIMNLVSNTRQWRKHEASLRTMAKTFYVTPTRI